MFYRLIIHWPDGSRSQSSPSPQTRSELGLHAMRFIGEQVPGITVGEGKALGREVRDAEVGQVIEHPSGFTFQVVEFK